MAPDQCLIELFQACWRSVVSDNEPGFKAGDPVHRNSQARNDAVENVEK
jgi:hypothetical protein